MAYATQAQVDASLKKLGNYRVRRAQAVASQGESDGISGALLLALGMRETWGANVEGGAVFDPVGNKWVPQPDPDKMDVGWLQISRIYHRSSLSKMVAVASGTWTPVIAGRSPLQAGFVPRFEDSLQFTLSEIHEAMAYAEDNDVALADRVRFAIAAHNAGFGGALSGYKSGDVDMFTANSDYSAWVLHARKNVNHFLQTYPNWRG